MLLLCQKRAKNSRFQRFRLRMEGRKLPRTVFFLLLCLFFGGERSPTASPFVNRWDFNRTVTVGMVGCSIIKKIKYGMVFKKRRRKIVGIATFCGLASYMPASERLDHLANFFNEEITKANFIISSKLIGVIH